MLFYAFKMVVSISSLCVTLLAVFGIFGPETVWLQKPVKWVVLPFKSSLAFIKQVSNRLGVYNHLSNFDKT